MQPSPLRGMFAFLAHQTQAKSVPHLSAKAWKFLSAVLMASTIVFGGNAVSFAQADLTKSSRGGEPEQLTKVYFEPPTHEHWLGYNLMKLANDPLAQRGFENVLADYETPEVKAFLEATKKNAEALEKRLMQPTEIDKKI
jgi:hypothetical protein